MQQTCYIFLKACGRELSSKKRGDSLKLQEEIIREYAEESNLKVEKVFVEEENCVTTESDVFHEMLVEMGVRRVSTLIVSDRYGICKSKEEIILLQNYLSDFECKLVLLPPSYKIDGVGFTGMQLLLGDVICEVGEYLETRGNEFSDHIYQEGA